MSTKIQWTVQLNVREGKLEDSRALAEEMCASATNEPGAVQYEWFCAEDGSISHFLEEYKDSEASIAHLQTFLSQFVGRFLECFEPTGLFVYGAPSDALKAILEPLGPVYLGMVTGFAR